MTTLEPEELQDIFDDLDDLVTPALAEGEFTVSMYANMKRHTYNVAAAIIKRAVREGRYEDVGVRLLNGRRQRAFRRTRC